jgi:signal transduction histidine kinase/ligand-binding sensor domain-containing protein/DNA-binding response OmpR family regulator
MRNIRHLIIGFLLSSATIAYGQSQKIEFEHLTIDDGLSNDVINCFLKDNQGFMWIGTDNGLNKFDGYNFKVYKHISLDTTSLLSDAITALLQDKRGNIWIGTNKGLVQYVPEKEIFKINPLVYPDEITSVYEDKKGDIYISCADSIYQLAYDEKLTLRLIRKTWMGEGVIGFAEDSTFLWILSHEALYQKDPKSGAVSKYQYSGKDIASPTSENNALYKDSQGRFWISKSSGMDVLHPSSGKRIARWPIKKSNYFPEASNVIGVCEDEHHNMWMSTVSNGLLILDHALHKYEAVRNDPRDPASINSHQLKCIYKDRSGVIWVGSQNEGINKYDPIRQRFKNQVSEINTHTQRANRSVKSIYQDKLGYYWIGTDYGLNKTDSNFHILKTFRHDPANPNSISLGGIVSITEDNTSNLLVGSWGGSLNKLNRAAHTFSHYKYQDEIDTIDNQLASNCVMDIAVDKHNDLWLALINGYLERWDAETKKIEHFNLHAFWLSDLLIDNTIIWCANTAGLVRFNTITKKYQLFTGKDFNQAWQRVYAISKDKNNILWLATSHGLVHFDAVKKNAEVFNVTHGLLSDFILTLQIDKNGMIWASSDKGISKFNPITRQCFNYEKNDGIKINAGYSYQNKNGMLFFGGTNGLNVFNPDEIVNNPTPPNIEITGFKLFNKPVPIGSSMLKQSINTTREIILDFDQTVITFEFVALNLTLSEKNQYAYQLEGFDTEWQLIGTRREATFTNLDPGIYTFRVKASNNDGIWNEKGTSISLIIQPPFWKTWWFKTLLGLVLVLGIIFWNRYKTYRIRARNDELQSIVNMRTLQLEKQKTEAERMATALHETDQKRIRFLINISHEFRTPLTLIINPVEKIISKIADYPEISSLLRTISRNSKSLLNLINQVLDMRKLETNNMTLEVGQHNIHAYLQNIYESFMPLAESQKISFSFNTNLKNDLMWFDAQKIERVLINLLSNAFKFTPNAGAIELQATKSEHDDFVTIKIRDTGIGIPNDKIEFIFDPFYQVKSEKANAAYGTGIGLNIAKEFIMLHQGSIDVTSTVAKGSCFSITFPIQKECFKTDEITYTIHAKAISAEKVDVASIENSSTDEIVIKAPKNASLVLLVEDNADLRLFVKQNLSAFYKVIEAPDGVIGYAMVKDKHPDLIISDIVMPNMNGFELCEKIKTDEEVCHIPVILLTSQNEEDKQLHGLAIQADDYITKPFNIQILNARIQSILQNRKLMRTRFAKEFKVAPSEIVLTSFDQKLLQRAIEAVEKNMEDVDFDVEKFSNEMCLSSRQLFNKLKALTDLSPGDFIRTIKLKRAAQLIAQSGLNIIEIANETGYKNADHFRTAFKKQFGVTPSEYKEQLFKSQITHL